MKTQRTLIYLAMIVLVSSLLSWPSSATSQRNTPGLTKGASPFQAAYPITITTWARLTTDPNGDSCPTWSPGGDRISWTHWGNSWNRNVWSMNADGSDKTQLTSFSVAQKSDYSPDGQQIVFERYHHDSRTDILVMDADGSDITPLLTSGYNGQPDWSPDGGKIAYQSEPHVGSATCHIYIMNADGAHVTQLTTGEWVHRCPDWSPSGGRIAFHSNSAGGSHIYVMNADGSDLTQLTFGDYIDTAPVWSPDGTQIAFVRKASSSSSSHIYVMDSNGSNVIQLTDSDGREMEPSWSPDGSKLAFNAHLDGRRGDIYVLDLVVSATVDVNPDVLNLKSKGKWITTYVELPNGYDATDIDAGTVILEGTIPAEDHPTKIGDHDNDNILDLMVKFDRQALIEYLDGTTGEVTLTLSGQLNDGIPFEGSDTITVINPGKK